MWQGLGFATKTVVQERFKYLEEKLSRAIMQGATKRLCFSCSPGCWPLAEDAATEHGLFSTPLISKLSYRTHPIVHHPIACGSIHSGRLWKLKPPPQQFVKGCLLPALWSALAPLSGNHLCPFQLSEWLLFLWKFKPGAGSSHNPTSPSTLMLQHVARTSLQTHPCSYCPLYSQQILPVSLQESQRGIDYHSHLHCALALWSMDRLQYSKTSLNYLLISSTINSWPLSWLTECCTSLKSFMLMIIFSGFCS